LALECRHVMKEVRTSTSSEKKVKLSSAPGSGLFVNDFLAVLTNWREKFCDLDKWDFTKGDESLTIDFRKKEVNYFNLKESLAPQIIVKNARRVAFKFEPEEKSLVFVGENGTYEIRDGKIHNFKEKEKANSAIHSIVTTVFHKKPPRPN